MSKDFVTERDLTSKIREELLPRVPKMFRGKVQEHIPFLVKYLLDHYILIPKGD